MSAMVAGYPHSFFSDSGVSATVVNGLNDTNRRVRKKSIGKLYSKISEINGSDEDISGLSEVFKCLKTPLLRLLCDDSEFCRDISLKLLELFFSLATGRLDATISNHANDFGTSCYWKKICRKLRRSKT